MSLSGTHWASTRLFLRCPLTLHQASNGEQHLSPQRFHGANTAVLPRAQKWPPRIRGHLLKDTLETQSFRIRVHEEHAEMYMRQGSGTLVHLAMANDIEGTHGFAGCKSQPYDITYEVLVLCCMARQQVCHSCPRGGCLPTSSNPNSLPEAHLQTPFVGESKG